MIAKIVKIKTYLNGVFTVFKKRTKVEDVYWVTCIGEAYYPKKNGSFFINDPFGNVGFKVAPSPDDSVIGFPTNSQAMSFINTYKTR